MRWNRQGLALALVLGSLATGCGEPAVPPVEKRTVHDVDRGIHFVVPPRWTYLGEEVLSPSGSIFFIEIISLEDADPAFVKELPESIVQQLEARTRYFFGVVLDPVREKVTVGGEPGLRVTFPVRVRSTDPPSEVVYWVVKFGGNLYALRATYPAGFASKDSPAVAEIIASWQFV